MKNKILISLCIVCASLGTAFCFETKILPNGQTVVVEQIKNNPIVIIDTWVKTGSINENDKNTGVSHFLEHLLFKGSQNYSTGEFDRILESKGGIVNASTSKDFTHFYIQIPSKYFDTALDLHSDLLLRPTIPDNELEKERFVVIEEISKDANNPDRKVYENFIDKLYTTHPYKRKVIGTKEIITNISKKEILDYYNKYYIPQNMITIIAGDVEPNYVFNKVQEKFSGNKKTLIKNFNKKEKLISKQITLFDYQPVNSGYMIIGYRSSDIYSSDTYALDVLSTILGDGKSSVFYKNIKDEKQLAFNIDVTNSTYKEDGMFMVEANFMPENLETLKKEIFSEIDEIVQNGVSDKQVQLAKKLIEHETKYSRESVSNISSQIGYTTVLTDTTKYYDNYLNNINKVTKEDIQRVAKKYLTQNKSIISIVLPEEYQNKNEQVKTNINHNAKLIKDNDGVKKYTLDNNSTVLINKNTSNDIVAISIYAKGGNFIEKIPSTSNIMASAMLKGTKKYSKQELSKIMEENGIKIYPQSSSDSFIIDVITTKSELNKTMDLIDELVNNAVFSEDDIEKFKKEKINSIKKSQDNPMNKSLDAFRDMIFGNSVYSISNNRFLNNYKKIKREDIVSYYNKIFNAKNIVISVNGDIDINDVVNPLSEIFKNKGELFTYKNKTIPNLTSPKTSTKTMKNLETAWLFTGWQTCGIQNEKDWAALTVMDSLLGSGMSSRLFVDLREKEGLAYQIGSSYSPKILKGAFIMYIGTNPKTLDKSKSMLMQEINRLKTEPVNNVELQEAKDKVIGRYIMSQETNLDKASLIGWFEIAQKGFDFGKRYEELINSITANDIIMTANKYFNNNNVTSIITSEEN